MPYGTNISNSTAITYTGEIAMNALLSLFKPTRASLERVFEAKLTSILVDGDNKTIYLIFANAKVEKFKYSIDYS